MQIACERCGTNYVLDDKLIPPGGAPVQCTRCGLVFTARAPAGAPAPAPAPKPTAPPPSAQGSDPRMSTQLFGSSSPAPAPQPQSHSTQMFGAIPATGATAPTAPSPAAAPQPQTHSTQMFGALGSAAPAAPAPQPSPAVHSTQVFGAVAPAAAPQPAPNPGVHSTQMFGAAPASPASSAPASQPAAGVHSTQVFGAVPQAPQAVPVAPQPSAAAHATQTFGAAPAPAAQPSPSSTQMFGAVAAPPAAQPSFGAASAQQPAAHSTQMFGAPAQSPSAPITVFSKGTVAGADSQTLPATPPAGPERATPMFGLPAAPAPGSVAFGGAAYKPPDLSQASPSATIPFGVSPFAANPQVAQAPVDQTLLFGKAAPAAAPAQPAPSWQAGAGQSDPEAPTLRDMPRPSLEMPRIPDVAPAPQATAPSAQPVEPAAAPAAPLPTPSWMGQPQAEENLQPSPGAQPARTRVTGERPAPLPMAPMQDFGSQTMELQAALEQSRRRVPMIIGVVLLVLAVAGGLYLWQSTRTPMPDPAHIAADEAALQLLRKDDTKSLLAAIEAWQQLEAKAPEYAPAKANQMIAYVLLTQDARAEIERVKARANLVEKEMARIKEKKSTPDWHARANAKRDELMEIKKTYDPLVEQASEYDSKSGELLKASKGLVERTGLDAGVVLRASAIYYAVKGNESAESLVKRYREALDERKVFNDDSRAFAELAMAALQAQSRVSPEMRYKGVRHVAETLRKDAKMLRAHLLKAKLHFAAREYQEAKDTLTELLVLNPGHTAAAALKEDVIAAQAKAEKLKSESAKD